MVELETGVALFFRQWKALVKKNALLSWRNRKFTSAFLLLPFGVFLILFLLDKANTASVGVQSSEKKVRHPEAWFIRGIPPCEEKFYIVKPCYDFVYSGNSSLATRIVGSIMANNPGRPIPPSKVKSFRTEYEVDQWLYTKPLRCPMVLHFQNRNATFISYGIQTDLGGLWQRNKDPVFKFQVPLQVAAEREIAKFLLNDTSFSWTVGFKEYPHPAPVEHEGGISFVTAAPFFLLITLQFSFAFQIYAVVNEKELKLRQAMNVMGLYDSAYWLSWLAWEGIMSVLFSLLTVLSGILFHFDFFFSSSFAILFILFFLFQFNMVAVAYLLSSFVTKASSALTVAFLFFVISLGFQIAIYLSKIGKPGSDILKFIPSNTLFQAVELLAEGGISWSNRTKCPPLVGDGCLTINSAFLRLTTSFFVWITVAMYFDNIMPGPNGVRKPVFYFLNPRYWTGKSHSGGGGGISASRMKYTAPDDEDVLEEENVVKQQMNSGAPDPDVAVQILGLAKIYRGKINFCCKAAKPFYAIWGLWLNFKKDQLFCLLGPNGAGKTTTIGCLTGIISVTGGDAFVYGNSIRSTAGMLNIRKLIGVCPQFDILWRQLSGEEHLQLFADIKGLPAYTIKEAVKESLAEVGLTDKAKVTAGSFSGGMKRRLSVAIAFLGDPKLVILDEPTSGMDPISRRQVWDIIERGKKGRSIILTTHSMEEADILGDRIGIMARGRLRCIGTSIRLKSKFGSGFVANIRFNEFNNGGNPINLENTKSFFKQQLAASPKEECEAFLTYIIPREKEPMLKTFFAKLEAREGELGITDIQLGLTTLEEVFLNIAKEAEAETAVAEGRMETLTLASGTEVQVPVGARYVAIPGMETEANPSGMMVEVHWSQDDSGSLCISSHSDEKPVPPGVPMNTSAHTLRSQRSKKRAKVQGIVIDPSHVNNTNQIQ